ncbi:MAG: caspase family protein [Bacteroidaceae bacterium]|nr:caspase family protein [Bacteroidaceae bacterium]
MALFYYAGHGIQYNGKNYLIPIDAELQKESYIEDDCVNANRVLAALDESECKMKIMILDACRDNPFERSWNRSRGGSTTRGLAQMSAPIGTVIAYATSPGSVAQDGTGHRNSPYADAFLKTLDKPNLAIFDFFNEVATMVYDYTKEQQMPWNTNSPLRGNFYFNPK